ncbi:MAG: SRPBCC domain-containing protein [Paludibaculum sp.]
MTGQTVTVRRTIQASHEEVFDAWLDAEGMSSWMCPGAVTGCEVDLEPRVGGRFRIVMLAAQARFVNTGEFLVLDRPSRLQFTWISSRWDGQETLVTVELLDRAAHCELVLTHERFPMVHSATQLVTGWTQMLEKLQRRLEARVGS